MFALIERSRASSSLGERYHEEAIKKIKIMQTSEESLEA
jgi:hypothetical protein